MRHVEIRDLTCDRSERALYLAGYVDSPITDVHLINCRLQNVVDESVIEPVEDLVFDAGTLSSRVYYCRMRADGRSAVRKVVRIR